jgi:hypothetical protein
VIAHNSSELGKQLSIDLRDTLVRRPGWILEASKKVSWILRKKGSPVISDYRSILEALDIAENSPVDKIIMNPNYDPGDKMSNQYDRAFKNPNIGEIKMVPETLFGTRPCVYDSTDCNRMCLSSGGRLRRRRTRRYKQNKRNKRKSIRRRK